MIGGFTGWKFVVVESDLNLFNFGISTLTEYVLSNFGRDDFFDKVAYAFVSRGRRQFKCLYWDGNGFSLWHKLLNRRSLAPFKVVNLPISLAEFTLVLNGFSF